MTAKRPATRRTTRAATPQARTSPLHKAKAKAPARAATGAGVKKPATRAKLHPPPASRARPKAGRPCATWSSGRSTS